MGPKRATPKETPTTPTTRGRHTESIDATPTPLGTTDDNVVQNEEEEEEVMEVEVEVEDEAPAPKKKKRKGSNSSSSSRRSIRSQTAGFEPCAR